MQNAHELINIRDIDLFTKSKIRSYIFRGIKVFNLAAIIYHSNVELSSNKKCYRIVFCINDRDIKARQARALRLNRKLFHLKRIILLRAFLRNYNETFHKVEHRSSCQ